MPLYRYVCSKCDYTVEESRRIDDRDRLPVMCDVCRTPGAVHRETSMPAFHLKGAGWHNMEYNRHKRRKD